MRPQIHSLGRASGTRPYIGIMMFFSRDVEDAVPYISVGILLGKISSNPSQALFQKSPHPARGNRNDNEYQTIAQGGGIFAVKSLWEGGLGGTLSSERVPPREIPDYLWYLPPSAIWKAR